MQRIEKRSVTIAGHSTSVSLEPIFLDALEGLAGARHVSLPKLIAALDAKRAETGAGQSLSSVLRVAALRAYRDGELKSPLPGQKKGPSV